MVILHTQTKATPQDHGSDSCCVASLMALIFLAKNFGLLTKYVCVENCF